MRLYFPSRRALRILESRGAALVSERCSRVWGQGLGLSMRGLSGLQDEVPGGLGWYLMPIYLLIGPENPPLTCAAVPWTSSRVVQRLCQGCQLPDSRDPKECLWLGGHGMACWEG